MDGIVTQVDSLQPGEYLASQQAAMAIVSDKDIWVEANPKETDLTYVRPGNKATVTIDTYPGRTWQGVVDSVSPAPGRSEERRVGKECGSTGRSRWAA